MTGTRFTIEVRPTLPAPLARLEELASNLVYTWDRDVRHLFRLLDNHLYEACGANLKQFLRQVSQRILDAAAADQEFMREFRGVLDRYDLYRARELPAALQTAFQPRENLVAYFCFEFGFHESLPLYSGGLGILAADHCKAASDLALPLVAVGLLYHQGYFEQRIDAAGRQLEQYANTDFDALPFEIARDANGAELRVAAPVADGEVLLRIWRAAAGNAQVVLLDSNLEENTEPLRFVTHRLYDGGAGVRIRQEIVLGIGGVRALRALGMQPTVWHLNEGHAAFQIVERIRERIAEGQPFDAALEQVAAGTVFTTHTPVPAGHDVFADADVLRELGSYLTGIGDGLNRILGIGRNDHPGRINMTALALRGSRYHNGVSRIHGGVASRNESYIWPEVPPPDNPITYVTNGVHLQTFLALEWVKLFDARFPDWRKNIVNADYWRCLDDVSDEELLAVRKTLKTQLFVNLRRRLMAQHQRNGMAESRIARIVDFEQHHDVLVLGFARRFATYKRAMLLFRDLDRIVNLLSDSERPIIVVMAGKAHPNDEPGKALIQELCRLAQRPEIAGRLHVVENYDIALARALVAGVDVWLNTPEHPLEASGTSGIKAGINGSINLSVLDGWWAEAYAPDNGWAVRPHEPGWDAEHREREEASDLLDLLESSVIPEYFGAKASWAARARASMETVIPRFNSERMVREYVLRLYGPAARAARRLAADDGAAAAELAAWKHRIAACWEGVQIYRDDQPPTQVHDGDAVDITVCANLNGLKPADVRVECVVENELSETPGVTLIPFEPVAPADAGAEGARARFSLRLVPPYPGLQSYRIRLYPYHTLLSHTFELGRMRWV